jgi:Uma2 family endonuclease
MSTPTLPRTLAEQHALNRQVWERIVDDPRWEDTLEKVETDRDGNLIMSPPPRTSHRLRQDHINLLLKRLLPQGGSFVEGAVSTTEGTKVADVVWYRSEQARFFEANDTVLPDFAPDICVEVRSQKDTDRKMRKKAAVYFGAGVREVWVCDQDGTMNFYSPEGPLERSNICPDFPRNVPATFMPL